MGVFDKLKFWKKNEPSFAPPQLGDFGGEGPAPFEVPGPKEGITKPPTMEPVGEPTFGAPTLQPTGFAQPAPQASIELISAKLDTLKVMMENISARLARLEQMAEEASKTEVVAPKRSQPQVRWEY